ncbi:methylamine utilization protein [Acidovorax sp. GBBC 3334]|uniref:methylamine utilization protein n=1 Tax=Acidovorax sp. GBBC 3334 TaxID=2940496 RepID=UPI003FA40789
MKTGVTASAVALALCLWGCAASAALVQVQIQDGAGKPLPGAVAFLDSVQAKRQAKPLAAAEVAQEKRRFVPDVLVVTAGTSVQFPNHDTVRHHVYSFSPAKKFELKLYSGVPANPVLFDQPGVVVLGCNIHDQMVGWVLVVETPYFARSDASGSVRIDKVPPGEYTLRVWHAGLPVGAPAQALPLVVAEPGGAPVAVRLAGVVP